METGTISSKGQITIPKKIREFLNVDPSDKLIFIPVEEGKVLITTKSVPVASLIGMLRHKMPAKPGSVAEMDRVVREKRAQRGMK